MDSRGGLDAEQVQAIGGSGYAAGGASGLTVSHGLPNSGGGGGGASAIGVSGGILVVAAGGGGGGGGQYNCWSNGGNADATDTLGGGRDGVQCVQGNSPSNYSAGGQTSASGNGAGGAVAWGSARCNCTPGNAATGNASATAGVNGGAGNTSAVTNYSGGGGGGGWYGGGGGAGANNNTQSVGGGGGGKSTYLSVLINGVSFSNGIIQYSDTVELWGRGSFHSDLYSIPQVSGQPGHATIKW